MTKKAIGCAEFDALNAEEQFELLHQDGVYVGKRKIDVQTVVLFQLYGFYVEIYYRQYRKKVARVLCSELIDILQPYIEQIHVRDLKRQNEN